MSYPLTAHGGTLVDLLLKGDDLKKLKEESAEFPSLTLSLRQLCDVEMLLNGGFSPLTGFMTEEQYNKVVVDLHLPNGLLWSMPITLDVTKEFAEKTKLGDKIALRDYEGSLIAVITVTDSWVPDKRKEAEHVFGSPDDECHPSIEYLFREAGSHYIGGPLQELNSPSTTISSTIDTPPLLFERRSRGFAGTRWWLSKPETRCIDHTES